MKKRSVFLLLLASLMLLPACGGQEETLPEEDPAIQEELQDPQQDEETGEEPAADPEAGQPAEPEEEKPGSTSNTPENKPQDQNQNQTKPQTPSTPSPAPAPETKPEPAPETKPEASASLGQTLAGVFQSCDASASCQSIADKILSNEAVLFAGATMPVTPGLLSGFDNTEITGFSDSVMFAPAIGSIPFVGYIFQLDPATDSAAFIQTLQSSANPRWNVCVEADETVIQQKGDKVFFLMCPATLEG